MDGVNEYICICSSAWTGDNCQISVNPCADSPCVNGQCIEDGVGGYTCQCDPGYNGPTCQSDINECSSLPCQNGGTCYNLQARYTCTCREGYTGTNCEIVTFCDLSGTWYNQLGDEIVLDQTPTGMLLGSYKTAIESALGYDAGDSLVLGYSAKNVPLPTFGFTIVFRGGDTTTSWTGQCELCDGTEVLLTTWVSSDKASHCRESYLTNTIGRDRWTRYRQRLAPGRNDEL